MDQAIGNNQFGGFQKGFFNFLYQSFGGKSAPVEAATQQVKKKRVNAIQSIKLIS